MPFIEAREPRVYIPNKSQHDYQDAKAFGRLVFLTTGDLPKLKIGQLFREMEPILADAIPEDYLMIAGPTTANVVATAILASRFEKLNYLIFDGLLGRYAPRTVILQRTRDARTTREAS